MQGVYGCLRCERGLHSAPAGPCRDGKLTGRQIRNAAPVCNRGWCFQSVAWRRLDLHVAVFKQVSAGPAGQRRLLCWTAAFPSQAGS